MRRRHFLKATLAAAGLPVLSTRAQTYSANLTALVGGLLIDGLGGEPLADSVVLIDGERILEVGTVVSLPVPDHALRISTEGCTLMPGLCDMNVHLSRLGHTDLTRWNEWYLPLAQRVVMPIAMDDLLRAGVTTVRDTASPLDAAITMRHRAAESMSAGPQIFTSGPDLTTEATTRWDRRFLGDPKESAVRVRELARSGVDLLVLRDIRFIPLPVLNAVVTTAHDLGLSVHAVADTDTDWATALACGIDGLIGLGDGSAPWSTLVMDALHRRLDIHRPLVVVSNLSPWWNYSWLLKNHEPFDDPQWTQRWPAVVAQDVRHSLTDTPTLAVAYPNTAARGDAIAARVAALLEGGALLVAGSGAGDPAHLPGRATWQEVEALVREAGLDVSEALRRATYWPAVALGEQHQRGTLSAGKFADLVCVRGDVLRHVDRLADIEYVYRRGVRCR